MKTATDISADLINRLRGNVVPWEEGDLEFAVAIKEALTAYAEDVARERVRAKAESFWTDGYRDELMKEAVDQGPTVLQACKAAYKEGYARGIEDAAKLWDCRSNLMQGWLPNAIAADIRALVKIQPEVDKK